MRDIAFLILALASLHLCLRSAFAAYLLWGWVGLIAIQQFAYGFMASFQYGTYFALFALTMVLIQRDTLPLRPQITGIGVLMIAFGLHAIASSVLSYPDLARKWEITTNLQKNILFALLMPVLIVNRDRLNALVLMICLSIAFHGAIVGLKFIASGGAHGSLGNGKFTDRNDLAVLTVMVMPLLIYVIWYARARWTRWLAIFGVLMTTLGVISTQSRGGFISLLITSVYLVLRSSRKVAGISTLVAIGALGLAIAPDSWFSRMETIREAGDDGSFMGRVTAWKRSSAIALEHPVFGGGIRSVQSAVLMEKYRFSEGLLGWVETPSPTYAAAAHSIYFEVLGDLGFVGLALFMLIMFSPFVVDWRIRAIARVVGPDGQWARDMSLVLCAGMAGYLSGGASISAAYFELGYYFVAMSFVALAIVRKQSLAQNRTGHVPVSGGAAT